jgi:hypothetical protein
MGLFSPATGLKPERVRLARMIALAADFVQVIAFPLFFGGFASPASDLLDIGMAITMTLLVGWHWAFVPTLLLEAAPALELFPTWTAAVFFVTRGQSGSAPSAALPPPPPPPE